MSYPEKFAELIEEVSIGDSDYDCVIPVSGGKDSTWQVVKALEFGLRPICVTWKSPGRNAIGNKKAIGSAKYEGSNAKDLTTNLPK